MSSSAAQIDTSDSPSEEREKTEDDKVKPCQVLERLMKSPDEMKALAKEKGDPSEDYLLALELFAKAKSKVEKSDPEE